MKKATTHYKGYTLVLIPPPVGYWIIIYNRFGNAIGAWNTLDDAAAWIDGNARKRRGL